MTYVECPGCGQLRSSECITQEFAVQRQEFPKLSIPWQLAKDGNAA
jgi:hypothetical protein